MTRTDTLAIIKPDALGRGRAGTIISHLEEEGFQVVAARVVHLRRHEAEAFYAVHRALLVRGMDAVSSLREVIGATDPAEAAAGTIRALYAESRERNAIHASDSPENAEFEIAFFFAGTERLAAAD
jgi:nucleoside-diphosphate kinase